MDVSHNPLFLSEQMQTIDDLDLLKCVAGGMFLAPGDSDTGDGGDGGGDGGGGGGGGGFAPSAADNVSNNNAANQATSSSVESDVFGGVPSGAPLPSGNMQGHAAPAKPASNP